MKLISTLWKICLASVASVMILTVPATGADWDKPVVFEPIDVTDISPAEVAEDELKPGLASRYYTDFFERDLRKLPKSDYSKFPSFQGKPILQLNHQFDIGKVFDSDTNRGVAIRMKGYIHFAEVGQYEMQALSNDGFILYLSDKQAINDPEQHSDRLSNVAKVSITHPGWYQTVAEYFQRKGTAALKLMWKTPGSSDFVPLPQSAYGHLP